MKRFLTLFLCLFLFSPFCVWAQEEGSADVVRARVDRIIEESRTEEMPYQLFEATGIKEPSAGERFIIDTRETPAPPPFFVEEGDRVILQVLVVDGEQRVYVSDIVRTGVLAWLGVLFALVTLVVGGFRGAAWLAGFGATLLVLFGWIVPKLVNGAPPVPVTIVGAVVILALSMLVSHGWNRRVMSAWVGALGGLFSVVILSELFVRAASLTGLGTEEAAYLRFEHATLDFQGLLLAGIILGACGALDDVAITQSETVFELKDANPRLSRQELFLRAMRVGREHVGSIVNTLLLAYAGPSLVLLLLFASVHAPAADVLNSEQIAGEIVRTLAGTLGLMLTVPLATLVASFAAKR